MPKKIHLAHVVSKHISQVEHVENTKDGTHDFIVVRSIDLRPLLQTPDSLGLRYSLREVSNRFTSNPYNLDFL